MEKKLLIALAETVLRNLYGWGTWERSKEWAKPTNCVSGLSFGDKVYTYNEDEDEIEEELVCAVHQGVGYTFYFGGEPRLNPVTKDRYYLTQQEAAEANRDAIFGSIEYHSERLAKAKEISRLLGQ